MPKWKVDKPARAKARTFRSRQSYQSSEGEPIRSGVTLWEGGGLSRVLIKQNAFGVAHEATPLRISLRYRESTFVSA
jgi:hypothetical protein